MSLHYERGRLSHDAALESGSVGGDPGRLGGSDVDDERALGDLLAAERDGYNVLADLLRVVAASIRRLIHLYIDTTHPTRCTAEPVGNPLADIQSKQNSTPSYLRPLIQNREHGRNLRSTTTALCQPFTTTTFAKRAFRCSAPAV